MTPIKPPYSRGDLSMAYQLRWSLTIFWLEKPPDPSEWMVPLASALEPDGIRPLEHEFAAPTTLRVLLSSQPHVAPVLVVGRTKGRLQHLLRQTIPKAFHRNYSIESVGDAPSGDITAYVGSQLQNHPLADPRFEAKLAPVQIDNPDVDLDSQRPTSHGRFSYNLHIVLVNDCRWRGIRIERLEMTRDAIVGTARKHGHLLRSAGILPDHLHLVIGCPEDVAPVDAALSYMNNVSAVHGMNRIFECGCYIGTFGRYGMGAIRKTLRHHPG